MSGGELLKVPDVAKMLGVAGRTVRQWCVDGKLPHMNFGDAYRFEESAIRQWMESKKRGYGPRKSSS